MNSLGMVTALKVALSVTDEVDRYAKPHGMSCKEGDVIRAALPKAEQIEKAYPLLVEALQFYANPDNWKEHDTCIGMTPSDAVDYGERARKALKAAGVE